MLERDFTEWTNSWRDDANHPHKRRWCILGDSVHRQYRSALQNICGKYNISIDVFCTSFQIEDPPYFQEVKNFLSYPEYHYEIIFLDPTRHYAFSRTTHLNKQICIIYKKMQKQALELAMQYAKHAVLLSTTPMAMPGNLEQYNEEINQEIQARNTVLSQIAKENNLLFIDQYAFCREHHLEFADRVHFSRRGSELLAEEVYEEVMKAGIIDQSGRLAESRSLEDRKIVFGGKRPILPFVYHRIDNIQNLTIPQIAGNRFNFYKYTKIYANSRYSVHIAGIEADFDEFTIGLYDFKYKSMIEYHIFSTKEDAYFNFHTGRDVDGIALCIYAGIAGATDGNTITFQRIEVVTATLDMVPKDNRKD